MRKRKQQVSDDNLIASISNKRSSTSEEKIGLFDQIPVDILINILSRLSLKSIVRSRCVSKQWSSIIRRPNYNLLFPVKSMEAQPRLLLAIKYAEWLFFSSSSQPQNPSKYSSLVTTRHHMTSVTEYYKLCRPVCGFVCFQYAENNYSVAVICNPATRESFTLPKLRMEGVKPEKINGLVRYSFGYDPVENQFKVLRITLSRNSYNSSVKYRVLTLGDEYGNLLWRKIRSCITHYPVDDNGICINGVLYYPAVLNNDEKRTIVCFDVKSEKFGFINIDQDMATKISEAFTFSLVNYKGKLGACNCDSYHNIFELWVLEDVEKHRWSKRINEMPEEWSSPTRYASYVCIAGTIDSGEIILCPCYTKDPFYVSYYNLEKNVIRSVRVEVPVFDHRWHRVFMFSNYVENEKLM